MSIAVYVIIATLLHVRVTSWYSQDSAYNYGLEIISASYTNILSISATLREDRAGYQDSR